MLSLFLCRVEQIKIDWFIECRLVFRHSIVCCTGWLHYGHRPIISTVFAGQRLQCGLTSWVVTQFTVRWEPTCNGSAAGCVVLRPVTSLTRRLIWRIMTSSESSSNHALNPSTVNIHTSNNLRQEGYVSVCLSVNRITKKNNYWSNIYTTLYEMVGHNTGISPLNPDLSRNFLKELSHCVIGDGKGSSGASWV